MGIYNANYVAWGCNIVKMAGGWFSDLRKKTYVLWHQSIPQHDCRCKYRKAGPIAGQAPFHIANNCWHQPGLFKPSEQTSSLELHVLQRTMWWKRMQDWQLCDTTTLDFSANRSEDEFRKGPPGVFPKNWPDSCSATVGPHDQLASAHHGDHGNLANWVPPSTAIGHGASDAFPLEMPGANLQYLGIGWDWWRWFRCQVQPKSTSTGEVGETKKVWALCTKFLLRNFKRKQFATLALCPSSSSKRTWSTMIPPALRATWRG